MKRTQLQLDEVTYQLLRRRAFEKGSSLAGLIREILREYLHAGKTKGGRLEDFKFVGSGGAGKSEVDPISEKHDEALADDFAR